MRQSASRSVPAAIAMASTIAIIVIVAVTALASVTQAPAVAAPAAERAAAFPPDRPTKVLVLGDSVMKGAEAQFAPALPDRDVTVDAEVNRSTGQGAEVIARRGTDWDVVVILLAHNDGGSPGVYQPAANRILDQLATVPRVIWLTLHEVRPYYRDVNAFLRDQADRRPNLWVADWSAKVDATPGAVAGDGLHLRGPGQALMANFVAASVVAAEAYAAPPPTTTTATTTTTTTSTSTTTAPTTTTATPTTTASTPTASNPTSTIAERATASAGDEEDGTGPSTPVVVASLAAAWLVVIGLALRRIRRRRATADLPEA